MISKEFESLIKGEYIRTVSPEESELEKLRKQVAKYRAEEDERHKAEAVQREKDGKKNFRNSIIVAAFSSAFTLFLEHINDIIHFMLEVFHSF